MNDLRPATELHGHTRAELDVDHLVEREAGGDPDEIERSTRLDERTQRRRARHAGAMLSSSNSSPVFTPSPVGIAGIGSIGGVVGRVVRGAVMSIDDRRVGRHEISGRRREAPRLGS